MIDAMNSFDRASNLTLGAALHKHLDLTNTLAESKIHKSRTDIAG